ncbi:hypothetical protein K501DRAFT_227418 [Backusella circina FSU 941]|nr:hypothetical protein K501DRAFT_227418 [Backusella circina FSU 941]
MSTQSFPHMNELLSSLMDPDHSAKQTVKPPTPDISIAYSSTAGPSLRPLDGAHLGQQQQRQPRPVSEILKPESFVSPETEALDQWFEDLQQYELSLESMASASLDPKYKEEVQHVDQWFKYLNETERTATIYTLLQHSTQVQIRFFITVLQQMSKKDPLGALLSPAHPEKADMQAQLAGAVAKAELEASQKLLSVLPFQTGQQSRPITAARRNMDRHSFALGDTEEYDRLFSSRMSSGNDFLAPRSSQQQQYLMEDNLMPPSRLSNRTSMLNRPKSVIEGGDLSSIFSRDWSYGNTGGLVSSQERAPGRPKSADITNWSFGMTSSVSSKSLREKQDKMASPWTLSPTVSTFDNNELSSANWLNNGTNSTSSNRTVLLNEDTKSFRRRANGNRIPGTVPETDEKPANIVLSMYDDKQQQPVFGSEGYSSYLMSNSRPTSPSPVPSQSNSKSLLFNNRSLPPKSPRMANYGQFLNPNDNRIEEGGGYYSDHSDASNRSGASRGKKKSYGHTRPKEKKNNEGVDMQLLEDVPAWLRSLRLHKYNPIFETMKWQDMLKMDDEALLEKGVAALGARRKLLKVFEQVKSHCETNNIAY